MENSEHIKITVRVSGHLRRFASGESTLALPRSAAVRDVFAALAQDSNEMRAALFKESGEPNNQVLVFVDDEQSQAEQPLADARSVTLMLPISGG